MLNKKLALVIRNNVNVEYLLDALKKHFGGDEEILKVFVFEDNSAFVTEYDGIAVTKWCIKDVYKLIDCYFLGIKYKDYEIVEII